ncbi:MAG: type II toxin-antitoxin system RelE/ParE family toxin [Panacagrimonas sp.]
MKPAIRSAQAEADIELALDFYLAEAAQAAVGFIDELEHATRHIELNPATGSPRYAHELNIPQLRFWPFKRFPYALFYIEHADHLDVIRCVHMSRDIPACLQDDAP